MPVLLKYRSTHFNLGWGIVYTAWHFFRMCQQYINHLEVEILPVYTPSQGTRWVSAVCLAYAFPIIEYLSVPL